MIWWAKLSQLELSIIFPAYNEEDNIVETMQRAMVFLESHQAEIIVVDDGSSDATVQRLQPFRNKIKIVQHSQNKGYGSALRSGFAHAQGKWIFFCDSDLQFPLDSLHDFLKHTHEYDLIIGYRFPRKDPHVRIINARIWRFLVNVSLGLSVRDINCAFKLIRASLLQEITLHAQGASINAELLSKLSSYQMIQLPVPHVPRTQGKQTGAHPRVIIRALQELAFLVFDAHFGSEARKPLQ